ncbi:DUF4055 domain-containing protein [Bradyrhizobium ottawaense]|uniref:DUF4055 domain-containing protein n=1 Tax=Bradyrhizobium ottawaense TaxID=931866 RepID=A0ABY0QH58_9BRAD|nr:DUF4055 domain-containing protein [Bradyrhizobium ottawaense]SDK40898.1 protein of unknown function [Bradyrhizobium ottawaense]
MADTTANYVPSPQAGNPGLLSAAATTMQNRTAMLRAVYGGTETMRAKDKTFLPQYEKESDARYNTRLASTFALNKLREAVDAASAKPFRTLLRVLNNTDPDVDLWTQDIDLQGTHLHVFAHQFFNNAMLDGMCHILVDHPDTYNLPNLAAQKASGARPFMKLFKVDDVAAAYDQYVGGDTKTVHVRIRGQRAARDGFKEVLYNQMRVIEIDPSKTSGIVQLWEQKATSGGSNWDFIGETPLNNMAEVPFATLYAGEKEADYQVRPVFIDLAYKQIEHWISSSDQRSILSAARFPMLACSGVQIDPEDEKQFAIGPYKVLYAPEANGRWYFVEPKGTAIESGAKDLDKLEMQMDMMALNPVTGTHRQYVPQNERDIQETRVHSVVHDMAINCQDTIEKALRFMGQWTGKDLSMVTALLNTEFSNTKDRLLEVAQLVKMWEERGLSREVLLTEVRNRNLLGDDFNLQDELAFWKAVDDANMLAADGMLPGRWTQADPAKEPGAAAAAAPANTTPASGSKQPLPNFPPGQLRPKKQI